MEEFTLSDDVPGLREKVFGSWHMDMSDYESLEDFYPTGTNERPEYIKGDEYVRPE